MNSPRRVQFLSGCALLRGTIDSLRSATCFQTNAKQSPLPQPHPSISHRGGRATRRERRRGSLHGFGLPDLCSSSFTLPKPQAPPPRSGSRALSVPLQSAEATRAPLPRCPPAPAPSPPQRPPHLPRRTHTAPHRPCGPVEGSRIIWVAQLHATSLAGGKGLLSPS